MLSLNLLPWRVEQHQKGFSALYMARFNLASLLSSDCFWLELF